MKIARASVHDAENLLDLLHKTGNLLKTIEIMSKCYRGSDKDDYPEIFAVIAAADEVGVMSFTGMATAALNLVALLDPANQVIDPDCPHLQAHPKTTADTARLDFLIRKGGAAFFENQVGDWQACAPSCLCEMADPEWSGYGGSPREAIDAAIKLSE